MPSTCAQASVGTQASSPRLSQWIEPAAAQPTIAMNRRVDSDNSVLRDEKLSSPRLVRPGSLEDRRLKSTTNGGLGLLTLLDSVGSPRVSSTAPASPRVARGRLKARVASSAESTTRSFSHDRSEKAAVHPMVALRLHLYSASTVLPAHDKHQYHQERLAKWPGSVPTREFVGVA